jgi:hypothetical protein
MEPKKDLDGLPEKPYQTPPNTESGSAPIGLPSLSIGERDLAEYYLKTGDEKDCASHFKIPPLTVQKLLADRNILTYIAIRQTDINESIGLTKEKVLARLNAILDNRLDASKNLLRGIEISAKVLGLIRPEMAVAIVNQSPYAQLTEKELETEIRRRLELPAFPVKIIETTAEEIKSPEVKQE